jgi:hypothetical protein
MTVILDKTLLTKFRNFDAWNSPTLMTWLSYAARSVSNLGILVFVLNTFPAGDNVLWNLFATIVGMQVLIDFGFRQTFSRLIAYAYGGATEIGLLDYTNVKNSNANQESNIPLITSIVSSMMIVYRSLTIVVFSLLITFGTWSMIKPISNASLVQQAWIAWIIVIVTTCINFYSKLYLNFLEGLNYIALVRRVEVFTSIGSIISSYLILIFSPTVLNLILASQFWLVVAALRDYILCNKIEDGLFKKVNIKQPVDKILLKKIWSPAWRSGISGLMSGGVTSLTSIIYAQFGSTESVASYMLALRIMSQIREVSMAPFYSKVPLLAILRVKNNTDTLIKTVKSSMQLSHFVFLIGFICTTFLIKPFLVIIRSEIVFVNMEFWCLLGAAIFANRFGTMHLHTYTSTNHIITHIADTISGLIYIFLIWILSQYSPTYAIPLSMLASYLFLSCFASFYSYKSLNKGSFWQFEKTVSIPFIMGFVVFSIAYVYLYDKL